MHKSNKEIENVIFNNEPDKDIEVFWIDLKHSIEIFSKKNNLNIPTDCWSSILNSHQLKKEYSNIKKYIQTFLYSYFLYIFKVRDSYNTSILWKNIKKWQKINSSSKIILDDNQYYYDISYLLLDIYKSLLNHNCDITEFYDFFRKVDENLEKKDTFTLLDLCIKKKQAYLIDKFKEYINVKEFVKNNYNININNSDDGIKIIKTIYNTKMSYEN